MIIFISDVMKIRIKFEWYDIGEKSTKFFLNLGKKRGVHNRIRKLIVIEKEITNPKEISNNIKVFCETFFRQNY